MEKCISVARGVIFAARRALKSLSYDATAAASGVSAAEKKRCHWARGSEAYIAYHDEEWGVPVHDDRHFFEMLVLEGAQAGLSWSTILNKRAAYRKAFERFDPRRVARYDAAKRRALMADAGIVRNRLKIESAVRNALVFLALNDATLHVDGAELYAMTMRVAIR